MYDWNFDDPFANTWVLLRQTWEAISQYLEFELSTHQVTLAQIELLMMLGASKTPLTESQIASYTFRSPQSVSELVARMESAGYLKKVRSTGDQRVVKIQMLSKGEEVVRKVRLAGFVYGSRVIKASLSADEIEVLSQVLTKLRDGILHEIALKSEPLPDVVDTPRLDRRRS
ncbi:MAG: MarR family transcriptional regulator [Chloroflexi bacterium]|nr:MarR family transcriptional regulator [Chloroflexota bacterium]